MTLMKTRVFINPWDDVFGLREESDTAFWNTTGD
jgi:hypothetical protein